MRPVSIGWFFLIVLALLVMGIWHARAAETGHLRFTILGKRLHKVDDRLFGHFLERASFGEPGPERALHPDTGRLQPQVVQMMQEMRIPIIRFPGGADVDYIDWRDMISNVPGRAPERPVTSGRDGKEITNHFGLDEYFQLRDALGSETILVVNFLDAVSKKIPLPEAAMRVAGLVAYVNAPVGAKLPKGMPDWPAVRAKNGHPEPYQVKYFQIGNEWWIRAFLHTAVKGAGLTDPEELGRWYVECLNAYIDLMRAVDPSIQFIIDAKMGKGIEHTVLTEPAIREKVRYVALHKYAPGPMDKLQYQGKPYPFKRMTTESWWNAWVAMPGDFSARGKNLVRGESMAFAMSLGYRVAYTEWNWNGWGFERITPKPEIDWLLAAGIGAAGFLHALMRRGDLIDIACQSVLVGSRWNITSIRVDPAAKLPPHFFPQGQVTMLYSRHHGQHRLEVHEENVPLYEQPIKMGWGSAPEKVAYVDLVATANDMTVYVHVINRDFSRRYDITLEFPEFRDVQASATHHLFTGRLYREPKEGEARAVGRLSRQQVTLQGQRLRITLPERSVNIIEIPRAAQRGVAK